MQVLILGCGDIGTRVGLSLLEGGGALRRRVATRIGCPINLTVTQ
ncbi:MAG: hypothetical protein CM15mP25_1860 [Gammaproteobacteria bacterium]|nr:MAG: hypothetical protein CM15mP25_1860 [Gammaproteobacteria bacterium]